MSTLFNRSFTLKLTPVNGEPIELTSAFDERRPDRVPAHIMFMVDVSPRQTLSIAEISIYGLNEETRRRIAQEFAEVELSAGYSYDGDDNTGLIFSGVIKNVQVVREESDMVLTMFCRSVSTYDDATIARSWGDNTPAKEIIQGVAETFGYPVVFYGDFDALPRALKGFSIAQDSKAAMQALASAYQFNWVIARGELSVYLPREGEAITPGLPFKYTPLTGIIGTPVLTEFGIDLKVGLNPAIRTYSQLLVENETGEFNFNAIYYQRARFGPGRGLYEVLSYRHVGDNYSSGPEWFTEMRARRLG